MKYSLGAKLFIAVWVLAFVVSVVWLGVLIYE
ncbi:Uncharacterised protein [Leminorella richardii]|uniref:Uncharacterized protein n=1 Tax=Leminorella richardii TaxID=158841 RepID=A0A2X4U8M1_9GAMM|nr:Uncharacterised protein [Leminorella richardii]